MIVACVLKSGGEYTQDYVNRLFFACAKHLSCSFKFVCLTDLSRKGFAKGVTIEELYNDWPGWWSKLELFRPFLFPFKESMIYLDLDTVIAGDFSHIAKCRSQFAGLRDFYGVRATGLATGILVWQHESWIEEIYDAALHFVDSEIDETNWKKQWDQVFLKKALQTIGVVPEYLQEKFKGEVLSYKVHCKDHVPVTAKIICFHGKPRPHQLPENHPIRVKYWSAYNGECYC